MNKITHINNGEDEGLSQQRFKILLLSAVTVFTIKCSVDFGRILTKTNHGVVVLRILRKMQRLEDKNRH